MKTFEVNFDGLVGLTHCYSGLSYGNIASMTHRSQVSNPREAALQGLEKAKALADLGLPQGILPPQERPDIGALKRIGFTGSDADIIRKAHAAAPELLATCSSASSMWTANAATVAPSRDTADGKVHFTAANLVQKFHRAIETETTTRLLQALFPNEKHFAHHPGLPATDALGDEGAANHTRLCHEYGGPGLHYFVYGRVGLDASTTAVLPKRFPARQTREASETLARLHLLKPEQTYYAQQNPDSIDAGAFHNDVVAVGNQNVLFFHQDAFYESKRVINELQKRFNTVCEGELIPVEVARADVPLIDAVKSYLFNSQLITLPSGKMCLVAPQECQEMPSVRGYLARLFEEKKTPLQSARYFNLRQSMQNGGGPACLRLRVVLNETELAATNPRALLNDSTYKALRDWVNKHYRDRLAPPDLADPKLLVEGRSALDELTQIMQLGSVYAFQK